MPGPGTDGPADRATARAVGSSPHPGPRRRLRGLPPAELPLLLRADSAFPKFCAVAGVIAAIMAGYTATRARGGATISESITAGVLTVVCHTAVIGVLGSPLSPPATAIYVALTLPAVCLGCYLGSPAEASLPAELR